MKKSILTILVLVFASQSFACINEYYTLLTGEVVFTSKHARFGGKVWGKSFDRHKLVEKADELLDLYKKEGSVKHFSDYAAALIYLGKYADAKKIYHNIESQSPDLYTTASNLGTIYELIGKPDSALIWIRKSIELNPESHDGSEWIHIKILEFKIKNELNYSGSILGLDFGDEAKPENPNEYNLKELESHIRHQLGERAIFIKAPNKIIGNIYFDLGNIVAQTHDVQMALESYHTSKEYGFESELLNQRIDKMESLAARAEFRREAEDFLKENFVFLIGGVLVLVILLGLWVGSRRKKR